MNKLFGCGCGKEVTHPTNMFLKGHSNKGKSRSEESKLKQSKSRTGIVFSELQKLNMSKNSKGMLGKHHSAETKLKLQLYGRTRKHTEEWKMNMRGRPSAYKGKKASPELKLKLSLAHKGKKLSVEQKLKMSIAIIKYIEKTKFNGGPMYPRLGYNETFILDQLQKSIKQNILRNDHNLSLVTGKFNDGFITKYNLAIDILEPHHFKNNEELSDNDQIRELLISSKLGCMIYYISEQEFLSNPDKEIQRFKDFILLLEEGSN